MVFVKRALEGEAQTLGERLRLLRRTQAVTMDMLVEATRIQRRYLEALEWGRYHELPDPLYTRNFIRAYARFLGADETYFLELFAQEIRRSDLLAPHRLPRSRAKKLLFFSVPQFATSILTVAFLLGGLSWIFFQVRAVFLPPDVVVSFPSEEMVVQEPFIRVEGVVRDLNASVRVEGVEVPLSPKGEFSYEVALLRGVNTIFVQARSRYSSDAEIARKVVYYPDRVDN